MTGAERVVALLAAASAGDADAMAEHWTDDYILELPYADPPILLEGKEAARDYLRGALGVFQFELHVTEVYVCPDRDTVIAEYLGDGRVTTTGAPYANQYIGVFELRDGKVRRQREFYNPLPAMRALHVAADVPAGPEDR